MPDSDPLDTEPPPAEDGAAVDEVFADTEPPPPPDEAEPGAPHCVYCNAVPTVCETHAQQLIAQAVTEEDEHRRTAGVRSAERAMRRAPSSSTIPDDAAALALVIRRWWGDDKLPLAQAILAILENDPK